MPIKNIKIAIVADWITNVGGDDQVLWAIHELYPKAPIYTTVYNAKKMPHYKNCDIRTTYINNLPLAKSKTQLYIPLMFGALRKLDLSEFDVIISSSHTVGKSITKPKGATHICYCHTPLRYVWAPEIDNLGDRINLGPFLKPLLKYLKKQDLISSKNVDYYIANSEIIAGRIKKAYGRKSHVIYPPVDTEKYQPHGNVTKKEYYLSAGRLIPYKKVDLIVETFNNYDKKLVVAGTGPEFSKLKEIAKDNIEFAGFVSDKKLVSLYQEAKGFVFAANEDFGIVPVEAMSAGTPVIAYGEGGATETIVSGKTGLFFLEQSVASLNDALKRFERLKILPGSCIKQAEKFSKENFINNIRDFVTKAIGERNERQ